MRNVLGSSTLERFARARTLLPEHESILRRFRKADDGATTGKHNKGALVGRLSRAFRFRCRWLNLKLVRKGGLEPPRYCYRQPLKLVRLPIPPLPQVARR